MSLKDDAEILSKAFLLLDKNAFIGTEDDDLQGRCDHWRDLARRAAIRIRDEIRKKGGDKNEKG